MISLKLPYSNKTKSTYQWRCQSWNIPAGLRWQCWTWSYCPRWGPSRMLPAAAPSFLAGRSPECWDSMLVPWSVARCRCRPALRCTRPAGRTAALPPGRQRALSASSGCWFPGPESRSCICCLQERNWCYWVLMINTEIYSVEKNSDC